jgi:hypothetical protein
MMTESKSVWDLKEAETWTADDFWSWYSILTDESFVVSLSGLPHLREVLEVVIDQQAERFLQKHQVSRSD